MSNKNFVIRDGVLVKYKGDEIGQSFSFPKGVTAIANNVFRFKEWHCDRIVIPASVETIGNNAFGEFLYSSVDEIVVKGNISEIGKGAFYGVNVKKIIFEGSIGKVGECAFGYSTIGSLSVSGGILSIGKRAFENCRELKMIDTPWIGKIGKDVFGDCDSMDVDAVYALLDNKPVENAVKKKPNTTKQKTTTEKDELCTPWRDIFDEKALDKTFAKLKGTDKHIGGVKLTDGTEAPSFLVKCAIVPYAEQLSGRLPKISDYKTACYQTQLNSNAESVAALLDCETLIDALKKLRSAGGSAWLIPYGRYANSEQVKQLLTDMKTWENWEAFSSSGRKDIIIARGALLLSDTKEAMLHLDKVGQLEMYAQVHGTDSNTIRDTVLSEFGFDKERKIRFDLGGNAVIVTLDHDLSLRLTDESSGKEVKSVPKKNADPELHKAASMNIKNLNKNIKNVITNRKKALLAEYLSGVSREFADWEQLYLMNPVLNAVARLVVWYQGDKTFTVTCDDAVDCNGDAYTFTDAPISVAHPIEVGDQLSAWRDYFASRGLKQPFEQIWEPVYKKEDISADRFKGYNIPAHRVIDMEVHGIHAYGFKYYSDNYGFTLTDCSLSYTCSPGSYIPGNDNDLTLDEFKFEKMTRYVNHIVYLFDKWTVSARILEDDVSVASCLHQFTVAQITEFIKLANENKCHNVTAILLDHLQNNFPGFDPMAEFTLE